MHTGRLGRRRFSDFREESSDETEKPKSKRYMRVLELLETEKNYVSILDTVLDIIRSIPAETDHPNSIFNHTEFVDEINTTFSQLPELLKTHRLIVTDLEAVVENWTEDASIGTIFTKYGPDLEAYVPFVNSFEKIKIFLTEWEARCKKFHAYLKFRQMEPGSGRQHLHDLLIRPVQRVPSVVSLLRDIKSRTDDSNPDSYELDKAITEVQRVLSFINEQKREAEVQELFQDIDDRPSNPFATFKTYICHLQCIELEDNQFDEKESTLTVILFQNVIEICKKNPSNSEKRYSDLSIPRQWSHIDYIPLDRVTELVDVPDAENCIHAFAMSLMSLDNEECRLKFVATGEFQAQKSAFLRQVAAQVAACSPTSRMTVLRRIHSSEMRIRTTSVLTAKNAGLKRSTSLAVRRLMKRLRRSIVNFIFSTSQVQFRSHSIIDKTVVKTRCERKNQSSLTARPASILC